MRLRYSDQKKRTFDTDDGSAGRSNFLLKRTLLSYVVTGVASAITPACGGSVIHQQPEQPRAAIQSSQADEEVSRLRESLATDQDHDERVQAVRELMSIVISSSDFDQINQAMSALGIALRDRELREEASNAFVFIFDISRTISDTTWDVAFDELLGFLESESVLDESHRTALRVLGDIAGRWLMVIAFDYDPGGEFGYIPAKARDLSTRSLAVFRQALEVDELREGMLQSLDWLSDPLQLSRGRVMVYETVVNFLESLPTDVSMIADESYHQAVVIAYRAMLDEDAGTLLGLRAFEVLSRLVPDESSE